MTNRQREKILKAAIRLRDRINKIIRELRAEAKRATATRKT